MNISKCNHEETQIHEELRQMSFEDLMKLKEELGSKIYGEAVFGTSTRRKKTGKDFQRDNKNRPREMSAKRPVPFFTQIKSTAKSEIRDPRFDSKCGDYNSKIFKENYEFITEIKQNEIKELKKKIKHCINEDEKKNIKLLIQKLENQNRQELKRKREEDLLKEEREQIKKCREEGKRPYYPKKKERKAKVLVQQFLELKQAGKLAHYLGKRRKKNASKDRRKLKSIDS